MEWNWYGINGNNPINFLLSESSGDSEEVKSDVDHDHEEDGAAMDIEQEGVLFRFNDVDDVVEDDGDDDAQSCSYDHSSYINNRCDNSSYDYDYDDDGDGDGDEDDGEIEDGEDKEKNKNRCETKQMDSSNQQWRSHKSCADPSKQRELDRKFWETCLAS